VLTLMGNISYTDQQASETLTAGTRPVEGAFTVDSYTLVNANAIYRFGGDEQYKVGLYINNLTDEHFCNGIRASDNANLAVAGNRGRHHGNITCTVSNSSTRTYGINFGMNFN
jgi:iron complex outermembrane recepter protein